jgi:hypothetical protein
VAIYLTGVGASAILVTYNAVDLTNHVKSVTINMDYNDVDITAMNATSVAHAPGLRDDSIEIEFFQDFAASSVHQTVNSFNGSATGATLVIQSSGSTVSTTNPKFTLLSSPYTYQPIDGTVGTASMTKVKFMPAASSAIVVGTS